MRPHGEDVCRLSLFKININGKFYQPPDDFFRFTRYGLSHLLTVSGMRFRISTPFAGFFWLMSRRCVNALTFFQGGLKWPIFLVFRSVFRFFPAFLVRFRRQPRSAARFHGARLHLHWGKERFPNVN